MKICPKCGSKYLDEYSFCSNCGSKVIPINDKKKTYLACGFVAIIVIIFIIGAWREHEKISSTKQEMESHSYQEDIEESINTLSTSDLRINEGWTTKVGGGLVFINGSVTNVSSLNTISYFEIDAEMYDYNGKVIDSDLIDYEKKLRPGESMEFQILFFDNEDMEDIRLSIKEVR